MNSFVFGFQEIDKTKSNIAGGKGANLGELTKIEGIHVPEGFCISTHAFKAVMEITFSIKELLERLSHLQLDQQNEIIEISGKIRGAIERAVVPGNIIQEIYKFISMLGETSAVAIRSSATAEDLPAASFAGQHETYLNIVGKDQILTHINKCWASLFTERAIVYRLQNGFDHRMVELSVVVQKMVFSEVAGIMFTADPLTSNREVLSIDASFGLGEALVAGLVNTDNYKVRKGEIIERKISNKKLAIYPSKNGGTMEESIGQEAQGRQALTDQQILDLAHIGRKIEEHFGTPQDIEWCLVDGKFSVVQARPITTLFPIPSVQPINADESVATNDQEQHVYLSVGHQQMMTDAMKPLGLSIFQLTAGRPMYPAGGRLFVDIAADLASPVKRDVFVNLFGKSDPVLKDALLTLLARENFIKTEPDGHTEARGETVNKVAPPSVFHTQIEYDATIVPDLIARSEASLQDLKQNIQTKSGTALVDFILEDIQQLNKSLADPKSFGVLITAMNASSWINEKIAEWFGEKNVADILTQSVPNNVTSQMGLELLDVADLIRPYPEMISFLKQATDDNLFGELMKLDGGKEVAAAIDGFLQKYGMRCAGEIDITRPRWIETPTAIVPIILSNIKNVAAGASTRRFQEGQQAAKKKEKELVDRLTQLPDGEEKAAETKRMINLIRNYAGYREYPKYVIVSRYLVYKQALLKEAEQLVNGNVIREKEDIYYLSAKELRSVVDNRKVDYQVISRRKEEYKIYEKLTPPRVITSDGEIITGRYNREAIPSKAFAGIAVSSGVAEGRARVIFGIEHADIEEGDILVTPFTDPSWTPLFVSIKGLVTEVGGIMTHGAVIAREYGLPAVVGVENATRLIQDGQRIRVHGTDGYVEILE